MAEYEGAVYMRTLRPEHEFLYSDDQVFNLGGFETLQEGRDILICAAGAMVHEANKAIETLDKAGISATLVDLYSIPFDREALLDLVSSNGGLVLSVEDNFGGGIGSAIADAILDSGDGFRLEQMHVTRIPKSCRTPEEILTLCGLDHAAIVKKVMGMLQVV
jgi:transketolase